MPKVRGRVADDIFAEIEADQDFSGAAGSLYVAPETEALHASVTEDLANEAKAVREANFKGQQMESAAMRDAMLSDPATAMQITMFENGALAAIQGMDTALIGQGLHEPAGSTVNGAGDTFGLFSKGEARQPNSSGSEDPFIYHGSSTGGSSTGISRKAGVIGTAIADLQETGMRRGQAVAMIYPKRGGRAPSF